MFNGLSLTVNEGDSLGIIGPSGSGKSLLLRYMMMLEKPDSGQIYLDGAELTENGADLNEAHKKIGMVFQDFNLFSHMSVVENVMSGMVHLQNVPTKEAYERALELLRTVGMADKAFAYPNALSGGQKQRAAIARVMAMKPEIILLDEPTSALDPTMKGEVEAVIKLMADEGHTLVLVSHEMELIRSVCEKVIYLDEGIVYEEGPTEKIFENADKNKTRRFVKALKVLEINVESKDFDFIGMQTTIATFAFRNNVPEELVYRLNSIMEELSQMVIIQPKEDNRLSASFEYNRKEKTINGTVFFTGPELDPDDLRYFFSWPIICKRASEIECCATTENGFTNKITMKLY